MRNRRVGTLTFGIILIGIGVLFVTHLFFPAAISYSLISRLWPVALILLGIEVLAAYIVNKEDKITYDGWAVFLMIVIIIMVCAIAGCQLLLDNGVIRGTIQF